MSRLLRICELSKSEQRVVLIVLLLLITIAFVGYERRVHHSPGGPAAIQPKPSPTAVKTLGEQ